MVTHEMEGGKLKCHRYWPDPTSTPPVMKQQYGAIHVEYVSTEQHATYAVRKFNVYFQDDIRELTHFYYQAWPDHGTYISAHLSLLSLTWSIFDLFNEYGIEFDYTCLGHSSKHVGIDWLDGNAGVPNTSDELLTFRHAVSSQVTNPDVPILIHCSAGVGM